MIKDLLTLFEFNGPAVEDLIKSGIRLKAELKAGKLRRPLKDKTVALIFQKPSLRTRATFETGIHQLGGYPIFLPSDSINIGSREAPEDIARNLERWVDGIIIRTFSQALIELLAKNASIPVINALTDDHHPCQALATGMTIREHFGRWKGLNVTFVGDGNNVAVSLFCLCAKLGMNATLLCPPKYEIHKPMMTRIMAEAKKTGVKIRETHDIKEGMRNADLVYTDVWASMGQEAEAVKRKRIFSALQVNKKLLSYAGRDVKVSHCLPAHRGEEITSDVLDSKACICLDEAENRLHVQKAVMAKLI